MLRASLLVLAFSPIALVAGCSSDDSAEDRSSVRAEVVDVRFEPSEHNALAVRVEVDLSVEGALEASLAGSTVPVEAGARRTHRFWLLGLHADETTQLELQPEGGATHTASYTTPPLPADLPPVRVVTANPDSAGVTLVSVGRWPRVGEGPVDLAWGALMGLDGDGRVVWYRRFPNQVNGLHVSPQGTIALNQFTLGASVVDGAGSQSVQLQAEGLLPVDDPAWTPVSVDTMHHDAYAGDGGLWTLGTELRRMGPGDCPNYEREYDVIADEVLKVAPSGEVLERWSLFDVLDPCRRVDDAFESGFWNGLYGDESADWTHANSVFVDAERNRVLVSLRHSDWVIALRHSANADGPAGELLWRLGAEGDFALESGEWFLHQHGAGVLPNGNVLLYDNGNTRAGHGFGPGQTLPYSRAVEYELDTSTPGAFTATQVWEHGPDDVRDPDTGARWFSPIVSSAEPTAAGTILIAHGALSTPYDRANFADPALDKSARLVEVSHDDERRVLWDVRIEDPGNAEWSGYSAFRAVRIDDIYALRVLVE